MAVISLAKSLTTARSSIGLGKVSTSIIALLPRLVCKHLKRFRSGQSMQVKHWLGHVLASLLPSIKELVKIFKTVTMHIMHQPHYAASQCAKKEKVFEVSAGVGRACALSNLGFNLAWCGSRCKAENTLEASLVRLVCESISENSGWGGSNAEEMRKKYMDFMQTPGSHNDCYASTCHRTLEPS
eukprot:4469385-Amphidinium_carterae.1